MLLALSASFFYDIIYRKQKTHMALKPSKKFSFIKLLGVFSLFLGVLLFSDLKNYSRLGLADTTGITTGTLRILPDTSAPLPPIILNPVASAPYGKFDLIIQSEYLATITVNSQDRGTIQALDGKIIIPVYIESTKNIFYLQATDSEGNQSAMTEITIAMGTSGGGGSGGGGTDGYTYTATSGGTVTTNYNNPPYPGTGSTGAIYPGETTTYPVPYVGPYPPTYYIPVSTLPPTSTSTSSTGSVASSSSGNYTRTFGFTNPFGIRNYTSTQTTTSSTSIDEIASDVDEFISNISNDQSTQTPPPEPSTAKPLPTTLLISNTPFNEAKKTIIIEDLIMSAIDYIKAYKEQKAQSEIAQATTETITINNVLQSLSSTTSNAQSTSASGGSESSGDEETNTEAETESLSAEEFTTIVNNFELLTEAAASTSEEIDQAAITEVQVKMEEAMALFNKDSDDDGKSDALELMTGEDSSQPEENPADLTLQDISGQILANPEFYIYGRSPTEYSLSIYAINSDSQKIYLGESRPDKNGYYSFVGKLSKEGEYDIVVYAYDSNGNEVDSVMDGKISYDTEAPQIPIFIERFADQASNLTADVTKVFKPGDILIQGITIPLAKVKLVFQGTEQSLDKEVLSEPLSGTFTIKEDENLKPGIYQVIIQAQDLSANILSSPLTLQFRVNESLLEGQIASVKDNWYWLLPLFILPIVMIARRKRDSKLASNLMFALPYILILEAIIFYLRA